MECLRKWLDAPPSTVPCTWLQYYYTENGAKKKFENAVGSHGLGIIITNYIG